MTRSTLIRLASLVVIGAAFAVLGPGCGSDNKNPTSPGGGGGGGTADVTISIVGNLGGNSYSPASATCTVGQKVAWKNNDSMAHTATSDPSGAAFNTGTLGAGATSAAITMNTAGSFPYHCTIHGVSMAGTLTVNP